MKYTISQLADIIDGDRGKNYPKQNEFFNDGYCLFLNTGNVTTEGFSFESNQFITKEKDSVLRKGKLQRRDIVYTTRGTVGNAAFYNNNILYEHVRINSGMVILRCNADVCDARFLYLILKSNYYRPYFKKYCTGSAQPQLPIKNFSKIELDIPNLATQHRIAYILSAYDDLIENNQKQIKLLEEVAQRLYKEWFVDLHFPGCEDTTIVDGIPNGWKKRRADSFFEITIGKTPSRAESQWFTNMTNGIPWASISDMGKSCVYLNSTEEGLTAEAVKRHNVKIVPQGTVLLSFKLTVGRIAIANQDLCTNEAIAHFYIHDQRLREYVYCYLKAFPYDILGSTSSISKAVNSKIIKAMPFIMPNLSLLAKFNELTCPIFNEIRNKVIQNKLLMEARDRLLPKLMNGELEATMNKKEPIQADKFEYIRKHWQNIPYNEDLPLAARRTGDISEETLEQLKKIAEEE